MLKRLATAIVIAVGLVLSALYRVDRLAGRRCTRAGAQQAQNYGITQVADGLYRAAENAHRTVFSLLVESAAVH